MKVARGQVSTELLIIIAAVLVLFIPLLVFTYFKSNEANEQIMQLQAQVVATRLTELANSVGSAGGNSSVIAEVSIPTTTKNMSIRSIGGGGEVILYTVTQNGPSDIIGLLKYDVQPAVFYFANSGLVRFEIYKDSEGKIVFKRLNSG